MASMKNREEAGNRNWLLCSARECVLPVMVQLRANCRASPCVTPRLFAALCFLLAAVLCIPRAAMGYLTLASNDWNDGTLQGWTENQSWISITNPGAGGVSNSGYLQVWFDATATESNEPGAEWWTLLQTPATNLFSGTWSSNSWVEFNFWASNTAPEYVQIRWAYTNDRVWRSTVFDYDSDTMNLQDWTKLVSPAFYNYTDWDYGGGDQDTFLNDLAAMNWIGVYIWRRGGGEQE